MVSGRRSGRGAARSRKGRTSHAVQVSHPPHPLSLRHPRAAAVAAPALAEPAVTEAAVAAPQELGTLLADGPFHEALRAAIAASGLSLDRIRERLRHRGTTVSAATLSSWQSGRYRPERPHALAALAVLEDVVQLPPGALGGLLGPPRPRGRWLPTAAGRPGIADVWSDRGDIDGALSRVDTRWDHALTRISCHTRLELNARGRELSVWNRRLLRAECDGPDRWITVFQLDNPGPLPRLRTAAPFRTGRVAESPQDRLLVAEVLFDRPLARGETVIVEYSLEHRAPLPHTAQVEATLHVPVREYVVEVRFDPAALPASCHSFRSADLDSPAQERLIRPDTVGSVHAVALAAGPCRFGIRWAWD
ncbi:hypothetical protein [Streptacidiphilus sp. PB12-B1b]|uniref:hypothetical protein n=1 Tax=Streptacidiphilus sp. PB12-B1b TaxID=2705012 RepID=UPI001CDC593A|nr:hypothetical protein [Streptacidiphilus sp. PB12-B1b]